MADDAVETASNTRNVEALRHMLQEYLGDRGASILAPWLASQGVLVPASLSNEQVCEWAAHESGITLAEWLERVATGEDDPL